MDIRLHRRLASAAGAALLLTGMALAVITPAAAAPSPAERTFKSLDEAAEAGAIDRTTVLTLRAGKKINAFVVFDGDAIAEAYGDGEKANIERASAMVKELRDTTLARYDVPTLQAYTLVPVALVTLTSEGLTLRLINDIAIRSIAADYVNELWAVNSLPLIRQPILGANGVDGRGASVAILDTGANFTHADLGSCTAPGTPASCRVPVAPEIAPDDRQLDDNGHGTNVSAIASGVAPGASIIPLDVSANGKNVADHDAIAGLDWVLLNRASRNIRSVNISWGSNQHHNTRCDGGWFSRNPYNWPFQMLRSAGALPVVAAGNDAVPGGRFSDGIAYPACTLGAVSVGATLMASGGTQVFSSCTMNAPTVVDTVACFSQDSSLLDLLAPGSGVSGGGLTISGTSQASPHVAGAAAVLAQVQPRSTSAELRSFLTTSSITVTDTRTGRTHPRLDLTDAVRAAVPVPNDNRATPMVLTSLGGRTTQTTWTATKESGEPDHAGNVGGSSVWFQWTAGQTGPAVFTTDGSDFDTLLAVYRDSAGTLLPLGSNDDNGQQTSTVTVSLTAGDTVLIAVDGKRPSGTTFPASGRLTLTWNLPNDQIAQAIPVTVGGAGVVNGSNVGATKETNEQHHCGDQYSNASVWYQLSPAAGLPVRVQASGARMLCVVVYSAPSNVAVPAFSQLTAVIAAADDYYPPIDFTFTPTSGKTYWVAVDGVSVEQNCNQWGQCFYTTPTGPFTMTFQ